MRLMISKGRANTWWWKTAHMAVPLIFLAAMFFWFPFRQRFEFDLDEGLNAMKALLVARGYPLYSQVWSDQPPVLTYLLAACFGLFGANVDAGRVLVLLFSTILMASAVQYLRMTWGIWHALAAGLFIFLLPFYTSLSVAVMVGLPSIALAVLSLLLLELWHQRRREVWLVLSALALVLSVLTKLFTGFLAPVFVIGLLLDERGRLGNSRSWGRMLRPALIWSLVFVVVCAVLGLILVGPAYLSQLITTHLFARQEASFIELSASQSITWHLRDAWPFLLMGGIGCAFAALERRWRSFYLLAWAGVAYVLLSFHAPVWYHHQFLITIPAAMSSAIAAGEVTKVVPRVIRSRAFASGGALLALLALAGGIAILGSRARLTYYSFALPAPLIPPEAPTGGHETDFLAEMTKYTTKTHWVVTDMPMYAFRVGLPVPPPLAAITDKRLASGEVSEEHIVQVIDDYQPEQVLMGRFNLPAVEAYLKKDYRRIYQWGRRRLYLDGELKRSLEAAQP
jgi:4-amino-4-deoxy-L-arabinose transferase-like glycosyltransferase